MQMLKLLYITGLYLPPETANGIRAYYFVRELVRSGFEVIVLETVSRAHSSGEEFFGERVIRLPLRSHGAHARMYDMLYKIFLIRNRLRGYYLRRNQILWLLPGLITTESLALQGKDGFNSFQRCLFLEGLYGLWR